MICDDEQSKINPYLSLIQECQQHHHLPNRVIVSSPFLHKRNISYGLIPYCKKTGRWLIVQRKHNPEFLIFLWGSYRLSILRDLVINFSKVEIELVQGFLERGLSVEYLKSLFPRSSPEDLTYMISRFCESSERTTTYLRETKGNEPEWLWPKGRQEVGETKISSAIREFTEETGISSVKGGRVITNRFFTENFVSVTGKRYQTQLWMVIFNEELPCPRADEKEYEEIQRREWVTTQEVYERFTSNRRLIFDEIRMFTAA